MAENGKFRCSKIVLLVMQTFLSSQHLHSLAPVVPCILDPHNVLYAKTVKHIDSEIL